MDALVGLLPYSRWILAVHLMAVIAWMAGLFYLPRLFVYHCQVAPGSTEDARFQTMERRLLRAIMNPAMIVAVACGAVLAAMPGLIDWSAGWWWAKVVSVVLMMGFHGMCARWRRGFAEGRNARPERFYRMANELPTVLMVVIVVAIIVRP
jgi:protoporphyrinogen IX oxidase